MDIGIFYGSTTGNTEEAVSALRDALEGHSVSLHNISTTPLARLADYPVVILAASTWGDGEIQEDWLGKEKLEGVDLSGKHVAVLGTGDQEGFPDSFVDAIGILAKAAEDAGAKLVGKWPTDNYTFAESAGLRDGEFLGLPLDFESQGELNEERISAWVAQLQREIDA